jgi:hypothetical protein
VPADLHTTTKLRGAGLKLVAPDDRTASRSSVMTDKPKQLSATARMLLTAAAMRDDI